MTTTATLLTDAAALRAAHAAGTWRPTPGETVLATDLARAQWTGPLLRAALRRDDAASVLAGVLEMAAAVLEASVADGRPDTDALEQLRQLVDRLAADS